MFIGILAACALAGALWLWWRARIASDPRRWPENAGLQATAALARRFLRRHGWTIGEPMPWINVFVRANRGTVWLNLMIHGPETLGLPLLLRDCIDKSMEAAVLVGILTRDAFLEDLRHDAERNGIYVIRPADLPDVEAHILRAAARQKALRDAAGPQDAAGPIDHAASPHRMARRGNG